MASPFTSIDEIAAVAVEGAFGEAVRLMPRVSGKYSAGGDDPARPERDCLALITIDQGVQRTDGDRIGKNFGFDVVAGEIRVSMTASLFPALSDLPRKGDHVQALDRPEQPLFEIVRVAPDNASRIVLHCARLTAP